MLTTTQLKIILQRLKNPSVLISIASQIITILVLLKVNVDVNLVSGIIAAICSILVLLGILSDPNTTNKGFNDIILPCENCGKNSRHVTINNDILCSMCGNKYKKK